jgi:hypothetical protein
LQLTAFGARDHCYFGSFCGAPRRQLKRNTLGGIQIERGLVHEMQLMVMQSNAIVC